MDISIRSRLNGLKQPEVRDRILREAVLKGAQLLDHYYPEWDQQIDPYTLPKFWEQPGPAIISALAGDVRLGYERLGLTSGEGDEELNSAGEYGFLPPLAEHTTDLAVTWVMLIASRGCPIPLEQFPRESVKIP